MRTCLIKLFGFNMILQKFRNPRLDFTDKSGLLQIGRMKNIVHAIDPKAYIAINEVADIFPSTNIVEEVEAVENDEK